MFVPWEGEACVARQSNEQVDDIRCCFVSPHQEGCVRRGVSYWRVLESLRADGGELTGCCGCQNPHQPVLCGERRSADGGCVGPRGPGLGFLGTIQHCCGPYTSLFLILASWAQEVGKENVRNL